jgi:hypothetical protein
MKEELIQIKSKKVLVKYLLKFNNLMEKLKTCSFILVKQGLYMMKKLKLLKQLISG